MLGAMSAIGERLEHVRSRMNAAMARAGRTDALQLLAVSKGHPASAIRDAFAAGHLEFGESYAQELAAKAGELSDLPIGFHFIGHLQRNKVKDVVRPLAERVRPRALDEISGQAHLIGPGKLLARAIEADRVPSMILWGPPGCGKTTLARVVAEHTRARFVPFNAVLGGVAELRTSIVAEARRAKDRGSAPSSSSTRSTASTSAQQDAFLPHVEDGTITLIGATTENPSFAVNAPLLSRCKVFRLAPSARTSSARCSRARSPRKRATRARSADHDALLALAKIADGDARRALTTLEVASSR
jgi:putative ATPase